MRPRWLILGLLPSCAGSTDKPDHPTRTHDDTATAGDTGTDTGPSYTEPEVTVEAPTTDAAYDECEQVCFTAKLTLAGHPLTGISGAVEIDEGGVIGSDVTDDQGELSACTSGITPGTRQVAFTFRVDGHKIRGFSSFTVYPFGYSMGLTKPLDPLDSIPWTPTLTRSAANPVLTGAEAWDSAGVILPSVVQTDTGWYMIVAGTSDVDYQVGGATSPDGLVWTEVPGNPVLPMTGSGWDSTATNSPFVLNEDGKLRVWYTGHSDDDILSLGIAESTDNGLTFTEIPENPVFSPDPDNSPWEGNGVAHPSILKRDDLYELWYSTDDHKIGYALSPDGIAWTRYCNNPVLEGTSGTWEDDQVKSAEVAWDGDEYVMTYSGGESGAFQVGWAASADGLRWVKADDPLMAPGADGTWESQSVLGAALVLDGDTVRIWYSGTNPSGSAIGYAEGTR